MPQYQFVAINAQGREQRGTVQADTREQAVSRLERNGLRPTHVDKVTKTFGEPSPNNAPMPAPVYAPPPVDFGPPPRRARRSVLGLFSFLFAFLAFLISSGTLVWLLFFRGGGGSGSLDRYDFSTAGNALKSMERMVANGDIVAQGELEQAITRFQKPKEQERIDERTKTLTIKEELDWKEKDRTIVLYSFEEDGKKKQKVAAFEKDKKTKRWLPLLGDEWRRELEKKDEDLFKKVKKWED